MELVAKAIAEFCRTFKTPRESAYDRFIAANRLEQKPLLSSNQTVKVTPGFDERALEGMKIFFNVERGNCVTCHAPPLFTDNSFHNKGTSQREYDRIHGEGTFSALSIPNAVNAKRPANTFREAPSSYKPGYVDLGHWNFVDLKTSSMRRTNESDDQFLERMIATFKTPTLRNLRYTFPYFHDGSINTLEDALSEMVRLSEMARAGRLRSADDEFVKVRINQADIPPLLAFLDSLNDDLKKVKGSGVRGQGTGNRD
jgi:cytochrome c peroxidase